MLVAPFLGESMKRDDRDVKSTQPLRNEDTSFTNAQRDNDLTEHCPSYSVLVRTFNSVATIRDTIASLQTQTSSPSRFIFVDSGSSDDTLALLPAGSIVHRYTGREFNYSGAINQGIPYIDTDCVLIMSSHTSLANKDALSFALRLLERDQTIGAAYFSLTPADTPTYELINRTTFTGFNGVFNTCGIYRTALLRTRSFRPEVFSAEDQEWSKWLLEHEGKVIARISGGGMIYNNPKRHSLKKWLDEWIAVATFTNRSLLNWYRIARVAGHVVKPRVGLRDRYFYSVLFVVLLFCKLSPDLVKPQHWRYQAPPEDQ
jgi:glycosyltransferase involved in cell wall biosynthesis